MEEAGVNLTYEQSKRWSPLSSFSICMGKSRECFTPPRRNQLERPVIYENIISTEDPFQAAWTGIKVLNNPVLSDFGGKSAFRLLLGIRRTCLV